MFSNLGFSELLIIFFIVLIIFGVGKLPEIGAGLGKGIRNFKKGVSGESDEIQESKDKELPKNSTKD